MPWAQTPLDEKEEREFLQTTRGSHVPAPYREEVDDVLTKAATDLSLTPKMRAFVEEWIKDGNGTRAALAAGYGSGKPNHAQGEATRLLASPKINKYIAVINKYALQRAGVTQERLLRRMADFAFSRAEDTVRDDGTPKALSEIPEETRRAIVGVEMQSLKTDEGYTLIPKYKLADAKAAVDTLMKIAGLQVDKIAIGGCDDMPAIKTESVSEKDAIRGLLFALAKHKAEREKDLTLVEHEAGEK